MLANTHITRFIRVLDDLDANGKRIPGLILSHPGFGKTTTVAAYCKYKDYNLITLVPSQNAPDDILGLQVVNHETGRMQRLTPSWFNKLEDTIANGKRTVLFIDEISTCDPYIQAPLLNLIFNRDLGEKRLPENVFILAAGNYSSDLDGAFKMSAPLLNRFVILNLNHRDFDINEMFNNIMDKLETAEEYESYFKLAPETPQFSFKAFSDWAQDKREINFAAVAESKEIPEVGIIGFSSIRSVSYVLTFVKQYVATYADGLWMRIAGDTLGTSATRQGKLLRDIFESNADLFNLANEQKDLRGISNICRDILKGKTLTKDLVAELAETINALDVKDLTLQDSELFSKVADMFTNNKEINYLNKILTDKMTSVL